MDQWKINTIKNVGQKYWILPDHQFKTHLFLFNFSIHEKNHRRADIVCANFRELWKFLDGGRLFSLIVEKKIINCENFFFNIKYLANL